MDECKGLTQKIDQLIVSVTRIEEQQKMKPSQNCSDHFDKIFVRKDNFQNHFNKRIKESGVLNVESLDQILIVKEKEREESLLRKGKILNVLGKIVITAIQVAAIFGAVMMAQGR